MNRQVRVAAWLCLIWAAISAGWAAYNCFGQIGAGTFVKGVFYFGSTDETGRVDSASVTAAVLFLLAAVGLLRGWSWARGFAIGVAAVGAYNWLRSTTGALFDPAQRSWFTGQTQGQLRLSTMLLGVAVFLALVLLLRRDRSSGETPWQPEPNAWTAAAQQVTQGGPQGQAYPQAPAQAYAQPPAQAYAQGQAYGQVAAPVQAFPQAPAQAQGYGQAAIYPQAAQPQGYGYPHQPIPQQPIPVQPAAGAGLAVPAAPVLPAAPAVPALSAVPTQLDQPQVPSHGAEALVPTPTIRTYPVPQQPSETAPQVAPAPGQMPTVALGLSAPAAGKTEITDNDPSGPQEPRDAVPPQGQHGTGE